MAYIEHTPSKDRREFSCIHSATKITLKEFYEIAPNSKKKEEIIKSLEPIGEGDYQKYGITCEARLQGVNSYLEGIATIFNENKNPEEVFDQLVQADQIVSSTHYSLNSQIANFVAKHMPQFKKQYKQFLFKKHKIGTKDAFCNGLIADAEKFYTDSNELAQVLLESGCGHRCIPEITELNILKILPQKCYTSVERLNLTHSNLNRFPLKIAQLTQIEKLILGDNQITKLPTNIGKLSQLKTLSLWNNKITSLPKEIGDLQNLEILTLDNNKITSLPKEIGNLKELRVLNLDNNQLFTIPEEIDNLNHSYTLYLDGNPLEFLPKSLCKKMQEGIVKTNIDFEYLCSK